MKCTKKGRPKERPHNNKTIGRPTVRFALFCQPHRPHDDQNGHHQPKNGHGLAIPFGTFLFFIDDSVHLYFIHKTDGVGWANHINANGVMYLLNANDRIVFFDFTNDCVPNDQCVRQSYFVRHERCVDFHNRVVHDCWVFGNRTF